MKKPSEPTPSEAVKFANVLSDAINIAPVELSPIELKLLQTFRAIDDRGQHDMLGMMNGVALDYPRIRRRLTLVPGGAK